MDFLFGLILGLVAGVLLSKPIREKVAALKAKIGA